jgi:signal transduction histidine kinase/ActR/RegA family two-component response regulator
MSDNSHPPGPPPSAEVASTILPSVRRSVRHKFLVVVLAITTSALLVMSAILVAFDLQSYHDSAVSDLLAQADLMGRATAAALAFDDADAARENLALLKVSPKVTAAAIYRANGKLFASYAVEGADPTDFPITPEVAGHRADGGYLTAFKRIEGRGGLLGTVYVKARYELWDRLFHYLAILSAVLLVSLLLAAWMSSWLQGTITQPILAITGVARKVMNQRDFSLRVHKTTEDEIGYLVDTFNAMLAEVGQRSQALEESHASLQLEMQTRRAAEERLLVADRRKDEFLATLAHELRNPLAPISNALAILRARPADSAAGETARAMMERQLRQLVRLVDDLLDVSRITTGKMELQLERVELRSIVQSAVETAVPMIEARRHRLEVALPGRPVLLNADATRLAQVFLNLLNNAAKFTPEGGRISLVAELDVMGELVVTVSDNGIGIAPEMLPAIFEMFAQVDHSIERTQAGLGVGLSLARHLVGLHGGTIVAESPGLGQGSRFVVWLAVLPAQSDREYRRTDAAATAGEDPHRFRILLSDDNEDFAASLELMLSSLGHEIRVTNDGETALEAFGEFRPDFAFLDIGLPKLNGYDLAMRIRGMPDAGNTVLVAITGWGQASDRQRSRDAGFDYHLVKPAEFQQIIDILDKPGRTAGPRQSPSTG